MLYDLLILGGGPGGFTAAERAGQAGLKVALFEKDALGGVCLNEAAFRQKQCLIPLSFMIMPIIAKSSLSKAWKSLLIKLK